MPVLENSQIRVEIAAEGAELRSIRTRPGDAEWLWQGDPQWWAGRAPLLFPVIGQSAGGHVTIAGQPYPMGSHGFARHSLFTVVSAEATVARLQLLPDAARHAAFPFAFALVLEYRLSGQGLRVRATVANHDRVPMPFQFGFHPAFCWPLPGAGDAPHRVVFPDGAPQRMMRPVAGGMIDPTALPVPATGQAIAMDPAHYAADAMVFPDLQGRRFRFEGGAAALEMRTEGLPDFALWQKPGAPFLCLEPWQGTAPFPQQGNALEERNNAVVLAPGDSRSFAMELRFHPATA